MERVLAAFDGPDFVNLRKAARAVIVAPLVLAIGLGAFDNPALATYAFFAGFAITVFADYGGPRLRRAGAYGTAIALGALAILLGAVLASSVIAATAGMFVVMFSATFATAFGGYRALHVAPIALAYSLSALEPVPDLAISDRLVGWMIGGVAALIAATVLWPIDRRGGLYEAAAVLAGDLGASVRSLRDPADSSSGLIRLRRDAAALHAALATPLRPYGPARRDVLFVHMTEHLVHSVDIVEELIVSGTTADSDAQLVGEIANSLERTQALLSGSPITDDRDEAIRQLDHVRALGKERIAHLATRRTADADGVTTMLRAIPLLSLSHVVLWIEAEASGIVDSGDHEAPILATAPEVRAEAPADDLRSRIRRSARVVRSETDPNGVVLRNSIRAGIALAASVVIADILPVEHGFWIVLTVLLVLHSSAHSTYTTAIGAIEGTLIGIALGTAVVVVIGGSVTLMWILLPFAVAIAAYFPGGVNFIAGQAAFGMVVIVLFELVDDPDVQTAVARVETVAVGAITATVLSLVLWPRGARAAMAASVASLYRTAADATSTFVRSEAADRHEKAAELIEAGRRAEASFAVALSEHGQAIDTAAWARVLAPSTLTRALVVGLVPVVGCEPAGCGRALAAVEHRRDAASDRLSTVADALARRSRAPAAFDAVANQELEQCVNSCAGSIEEMEEALLIVAWSAMLERLIDGVDAASGALDAVLAASAPHAWLFGPSRQHDSS